MDNMTGTVDGVTKDGKRFKIGEDWFSVFATSQLPPGGVARGDYVNFYYICKGEYNNIKGSVTKSVAPASTPVSAKAPSTERSFSNDRGFVVKEFPVPPLHPDRSIIRQNSLAHATTLVNGGTVDVVDIDTETVAKKVIEIARYFEAYSTGDLDVSMADEQVKQMLASEASQ